MGGRTAGTPNVMTPALKEMILDVATQLGSDGQGKDGVVGYFASLALKCPGIYLKLLGKLMRVEYLERRVRELEEQLRSRT